MTSIDSYVFKECATLSQVTFYAFNDSGLTQISIPDSVISINVYAFNECISLLQVAFPPSIHKYAFNGSGLIQIIIPDSV